MEGQDKLRSFYDKIKSNPNVTGLPDDYEVFKSALSDTNKAKGFYDTLKKGGAITGLPDDFSGFSSILPEPAENTEKTDSSPVITGFIPGLRQGADGLYQGGRSAAGEIANLGGTQGDYRKAIEQLDDLVANEYPVSVDFDPEKALLGHKAREYDKQLEQYRKDRDSWRKGFDDRSGWDYVKHVFDYPSRPVSPDERGTVAAYKYSVGDEVELNRVYKAIGEALREGKGDIGKAKEILQKKAEKEQWGDRVSREAREALSQHKPTEGAAAWVGQMLPQMVGNATAIAASVSPYTRWLARPLAKANMIALTASSAGSAMADAREYGASSGDVLRAGVLASGLEYFSEKLPFDRYFSGVQNYSRKKLGKAVADKIVSNDAARHELSGLIKKAGKEFSGRFFSKAGVKNFVGDVTVEGLSEFIAEGGGAMIPMIYQNEADYPTLKEILSQGWEGAKGGIFMGGILGGASNTIGYYANRNRRKEQGRIALADTGNGVVEVVGRSGGDRFSVVDAENKVSEISGEDILDYAIVGFDEFDGYAKRQTEENLKKAEESGRRIEYDDSVEVYENVLSGIPPDKVAVFEKVDDVSGYLEQYPEDSELLETFLTAKSQLFGSATNLFSGKANKKEGGIVTALDENGQSMYVLDETGDGSLVEYEDGSRKFVASSLLQDVKKESVEGYTARNMMNGITQERQARQVAVGDNVLYNGERARVQRVDDDGTVIEVGDNRVEKVPSGALQFDEGTQEAQAADPDAVVSETSVADVPTDAQPVQIPQTKEGRPDYNTMLESDPELFATEWEKRSTPESTRVALEKQSGNIGRKVESLLKNLEKESDFNKIADIEDEVKVFSDRKAKIDGLIAGRYALREEPVAAQQAKEFLDTDKQVDIKPVGRGFFGDIYDQFKGRANEAINFLLQKKEGEAIGALHHPQVGDIDLVWGTEGGAKSDGFGLSKIAKYHPEVLDNLQDIINDMSIVKATSNRINLESDTHKAAIRLEWDGEKKTWLLTAFEKETPIPIDRTTDIGENHNDLQNDTAPLQDISVSSESKDTEVPGEKQAKNEVLKSMAEQHEAEQQNDPYRTLTDEEVDVVMSQMQEDAVESPILELTPDNWTNEFGDNGVIDTPIGKVKMGENQYLKFAKLGRDSQLGMVKPTLTNPDVVIEDKSGGVDSERNSSYVYVKTFTDKSGKKHTYFTSVTVLKEGMEVSVSSHIKNKNRVKSLLKEGNLLWNRFGFDSDASGEYQDYTTVTALNPSDNERGTTSQSKLLSENKDTEVSGEKQAGDTDVHFRNVGDIEGINQRFNDELQQQITGTLPKGHVYQIGRPSSVLLSAGIPNLPIELSAERLLAKASKEYDSNHPFDLKNIENLPEALNHPIAVFDARKKNGGKVVLTELKQGDNNFVVALHVRKSDDSRKIDIEVNSVRSLYPKDRSNGILDWINGGLMNWVDKEKAFNFFSTQWPNYIASGGNTESSEVLSSATNILQNFQNPSIEEGKVSAEIDNMPDSFDFSKAIKEAKQKAVSSGVNKISYIKIGGERVIESYVPNPTKDKWTKDQAPFVWVKEASNGYIKEENDVDDVDVRYRERSSENVNEQFNRELDSLTEENANGKVFHLGIPSKSLLSVGIPNKPFRLYGNKLLKKAKKHGFKPTDIKNLPYALENPIAVFEGNHRSSYAILTELEIGDNKVLVSVETNKDGEIDFNLVSSVFGKSSRSIVNWINSDKLRFSDKEKTLNYLSASALNADATNNSELSSATNIAQNFVNPTLEDGEISSSIDELSQELGVKVNKVQSRDDLPEGMRRGMKGGRYPGLFDPKSGKVYVVLNEIENVADAQATVLHEVIGHKGIRGLFGERLPEFCERVLASLPEGKRVELLEKHEGNRQLAAEEYVAGFAEEYSDPSGWEKVKAIVKEFLRDLTGIDLKLSDNDLKYILWKAKNGLKEGGMMSAIEGVVRDNRVQDVLFRQQHPDLRTAEEFIKEKRSGLEATKERFVDSAVAVKELTDFLKGRGIKIRDFEDAYSESLLSDSKSYHAINRYQEQYQQPLNEAIAALRSKGRELRDVYHYLIAKHASERNREIGNREYEKWLDGKHRDLLAEKKKFEFFKKNGKKDDAEYDKKLKAFEEGVARSNRKFEEERAVKEVEFRSRIYAGMSDEDAAVIVRDFEAGCSKEEISNLWEKIRAATNFAIERQFKDGLIPKESYESMRGTYEYYIPLKGWEETDGVDYSASERYRTPANVSKLVEARGRVSMADNPVAYIEMAAEGAIVEGNRNYVRQCLYNMCVNNPDESLYSVNRTYYVEKDGEWIAQTEKPAKTLFDNGTAKTVLTDKPYKALVSDANAQRYDVTVLINGEKNTISFAQGSKGLDIADAINRTRMWKPGKVSRAFGHLTRFLSAQNTSRNPEFIVRNFERDFLYAVPAYAIKGGNSIKLIANLRPAFKALHTEFIQRGDKKNSELNRYMDEFLNAGGKTGFVHSLDMESRKRKAEREIRRIINRDSAGGRARAVGKAIGSTMEYLSDISENSIRFAVFLTERQAGKGVKEAAIAAKEITVNFNRKGTVTPAMSQYFAFFNAGVQGSLYNFLGLGLKWGNRFLVANAALGAIQMVAAQLSRCFGDDDELGVSDYDRLSDYTRNNNIVLPDIMRLSEYFGGGSNEEARKYGFMTIPMPQSFRAVSAVGIITDQVLRERKSPSDGITEIVDNILANMSPLDLETYNFTNGKPWMFFLRALPTAMQPVVDLMTNKNFMGSDVFKEPFTKNMEGVVPQSSLGMKNTNPLLVSMSKGLNRWANGTTDINPELQTDAATGDVSRNKMMSYVDINPAKVEHIIEGITGGAGKFVNNFFKTASSLVTGGELASRDIPFVRTHRTMPYRQTHWEMFFEARESVADTDFVANTHKKNRNFGIYTKILTNGGQLMNSTSYECIDKLVRGFREVAATATTEESKKNWTEIIDRTVLNWAKGQKQVYDEAIKDDDKKKKQ